MLVRGADPTDQRLCRSLGFCKLHSAVADLSCKWWGHLASRGGKGTEAPTPSIQAPRKLSQECSVCEASLDHKLIQTHSPLHNSRAGLGGTARASAAGALFPWPPPGDGGWAPSLLTFPAKTPGEDRLRHLRGTTNSLCHGQAGQVTQPKSRCWPAEPFRGPLQNQGLSKW